MKIPELNNTNAKREPFKVPEGYFEDFTAKMMTALPETEHTATSEKSQPSISIMQTTGEKPQASYTHFWNTSLYAKIKPYVYIAAMVGTIYFGVCIYKYYKATTEQNTTQLAQSQAPSHADLENMTEQEAYEYVNDACDYMMTDSYDVIACVTDGEK